jgi:20S proteasome subunit alpha 2
VQFAALSIVLLLVTFSIQSFIPIQQITITLHLYQSLRNNMYPVRKARKSAQSYHLEYKEPKPITQLVKSTASVMQEYTQSGGVRPFGVSLLVAGLDADNTPRLYQVDPSGAYFGWKATAIGKNYVNAKNFLEKRYQDDMELEDAIHTALLTLREGFEGEMNGGNIEVGVVGLDGKFRVLTESEVQDYLDEAN